MAQKGDFTLKGVEKVISRINKETRGLEDDSMKGLIEAAIAIRRAMDTKSPTIPVDTGNLRQSFFVTTARSTPRGGSPRFQGRDSGKMASQHSTVVSSHQAKAAGKLYPVLFMGFSANYVLEVHEKLDANVNWNRGTSGPRFFQTHLEGEVDLVINLIQKHAKK